MCGNYIIRGGDSEVGDLRAERINLLGEKKIVQLVMSHVIFANLGHCLLEHGVLDLILLDLLVHLQCVVHALLLILVKGISDLGGLVNMRLEVS